MMTTLHFCNRKIHTQARFASCTLLSRKELKFKGKSYSTREYQNDPDPWKHQVYTIAIPDAPHKGGENYLNRARLAKIWFKVSHPDDKRYLHPGAYSLGCITLTEIERWDELCMMLLKARSGDGKNIGVVEIIA